jgi:uncharacterized protein YjiS (DUF1127 family)
MEQNDFGTSVLAPSDCRDDGYGAGFWFDTPLSFRQPANRLSVWTVFARTNDLAAPHGLARSEAPDVARPHRDETNEFAPLGLISRIVATIREWCRRVRSRHELRELNDHVLKDIGLTRDAVAHEVAKPFWR